jgi:pimeloyl-ACP methyl ester carboxylesterase
MQLPISFRLTRHLCFAVLAIGALSLGQAHAADPVTHQTAKTQLLEAAGVQYAYRKLGPQTGTPLVFLMHVRGTMDDWDPEIVNGFAKDRPVYLFDNAGVGRSTGEVASTIAGTSHHVEVFLDALKLKKVDILGFSLGGIVAEQVAIERPDLVRRLIVASAAPQGGEGVGQAAPATMQHLVKEDPTDEDRIALFFTQTDRSKAAGRAFMDRLKTRTTADRDPVVPLKLFIRQSGAIRAWGAKQEEPGEQLKSIAAPTLVVNGSNDIMLHTINSYVIYQHIPNAKLILYPDSGHGAIFQYPRQFVADATAFLESGDE